MAKRVEERALRVGMPRANGPLVVVQRRAADRLRAGHLWVYRTDVEELVPALTGGGLVAGGPQVEGGALVTVVDSRGIPLGTGLFSAASQIAVRMVSAEASVTREGYLAMVRERLDAALALREELAPESLEENACRLVFSEADGLPGIVADRYHDVVVLQLLTQGTARDDIRRLVTEVLTERFALETVVERPDPRVRELEQLAAVSAEPLFVRGEAERAATRANAGPDITTNAGPSASLRMTDVLEGGDRVAKLATVFTINGLRFHFDAGAGQKTGAFLDQRLNYAAAARYARGVALDVCTYQGGFALHMATRCERVTGVDASRAALEVADRNRELNTGELNMGVVGEGVLRAVVDWIEADAFELLREFEGSGRRYDTIVLDPPAFAKSKRAAEGALRGYKEMNLRAMKMLRPGGTLVTCSCSHHVPLADFAEVVRAAAVDASRRVQVLETRGAAPDHPAVLTLPETSYLKCLICRVG